MSHKMSCKYATTVGTTVVCRSAEPPTGDHKRGTCSFSAMEINTNIILRYLHILLLSLPASTGKHT